MRDQIQNHNAFPLCRDRKEKIACVAEAMRRLGDNCTTETLKSSLGITQRELDAVADDARSLAAGLSVRQTRYSVPANRAFA